MAIKQQACFTASCDLCNSEFAGYPDLPTHFPTVVDAESEALDADWIQVKGDGRLFCDACSEALIAEGKVKESEADGYWEAVGDW